jgi:uroporphyrinogen-III synthase
VNCAIVPGPISSREFDVRLLVTRPEPDAERTAVVLRASGHFVIVAPLLRIEPVEDAEIAAGPFAAVLITSANAAPAIARHRRFGELRLLPVFAVGGGSAQAMRAAGFAHVASANGDARDLARLVAQRVESGALLAVFRLEVSSCTLSRSTVPLPSRSFRRLRPTPWPTASMVCYISRAAARKLTCAR